jgi:hypothetical protein
MKVIAPYSLGMARYEVSTKGEGDRYELGRNRYGLLCLWLRAILSGRNRDLWGLIST